ncbi:peptidase family M48-domain-containing protein [Gymnopilus junonius]|uniref:Peptidase family M48-domain-containing protein n=1 Tax=Gymnopilus junonius TaxID=109634 RepID=A0A9P5NHM9_GYMJU|nr:peptidase family M48-domain-containing protein [Gymnopilus junonius]
MFRVALTRIRPSLPILRPRSSPTLPPRTVGRVQQFSASSRRQAYIRFGEQGPAPKKPQHDLHWRHLDPRIKGSIIALGMGTIYYVSHLEQVPDTGRWRFMNTSPEFEAKVGELARKQLREELAPNTLPPNHPLSRHVRRVVSRILHASNLGVLRGEEQRTHLSPFGMGWDSEGNVWNPDVEFGAARDPKPVYGPTKEWDVIVVNDSKVINAMANPGIIVVFTGILPVCQDEEGLSAVLSHVARHSAERLSSQTIVWGLIVIGSMLGFDVGITDFAQKYLLELPNSRKQELEADLIGLRLMSRACYNPEASPQMFARLGKLESKFGKNLDFFQTHPSSDSRVKLLQEHLPEGYAILGANPDCELVRQELESFKETAHAIKPTKSGGFELD